MSARQILSTVGWGLFCAASWTWCIGMYLPMILVERFGWPGFMAFAVPNIAGVVIFGYTIDPARSERMIQQHHGAMRWFSIVTIAFHMFFLVALAEFTSGALPQSPYATTAIVAGPFIVGLFIASLPMRLGLAAACIAWLASISVFVETGFDGLSRVAWNGSMSMLQLAPLAIVLLFGFLLCPFFDLTFHRAIRESQSSHSLAVFAPAFAIMIVLTLAIWHRDNLDWRSLAFGHLLWQSALTMGLHLRELRDLPAPRSPLTATAIFAAPLIGIGLGMWAVHNEMSEPMYIRFLVFYGLVFPAYAVVFMQSGAPRTTRRALAIFALALGLAGPFYELGFIHERTWLLLVPVAGAIMWTMWRRRRASSAR